MTLDDLDEVTDQIREALGYGFHNTEHLATSVTGRAGEFYLTVDDHTYLVTIEPVEDDS